VTAERDHVLLIGFDTTGENRVEAVLRQLPAATSAT